MRYYPLLTLICGQKYEISYAKKHSRKPNTVCYVKEIELKETNQQTFRYIHKTISHSFISKKLSAGDEEMDTNIET